MVWIFPKSRCLPKITKIVCSCASVTPVIAICLYVKNPVLTWIKNFEKAIDYLIFQNDFSKPISSKHVYDAGKKSAKGPPKNMLLIFYRGGWQANFCCTSMRPSFQGVLERPSPTHPPPIYTPKKVVDPNDSGSRGCGGALSPPCQAHAIS